VPKAAYTWAIPERVALLANTAQEAAVVPWRADPAVLAGYLRLSLLNGSYVGQYLPQQAYMFDFAGELPCRCCQQCTSLLERQIAWDPVASKQSTALKAPAPSSDYHPNQ
jgi:hypothetical protein